jgi:hypothetical protein
MLLAPHHPSAGGIPETRASSGPSSVNWQGTVVMQSAGQEDSFAIGPDGCVWNFVRIPGQSPHLLPTGLKATSFAVSRDELGRLVVFAAHGMRMQVAVQNLEASSSDAHHWSPHACKKWSDVAPIHIPPLPFAQSVARVSCEGEGKHLHVGVLMLCQRPGLSDHFELAVSRWPQDGARLQRHVSKHAAWINCWEEALGELRRLASSAPTGRIQSMA